MSMVKKIEGLPDIKVIYTEASSEEQAKAGFISKNDAEMDRRIAAGVDAAIRRARVCGKPVALYDAATGRPYMEYANGERKYSG